MEKRSFGRTTEGQEASLYTITNSKGMNARILDFGATLVSLHVFDRDGKLQDVVLGYEDVEAYQRSTSYFGATVGRNCNRISGARFEIDGEVYELEPNDFGNNLHSGSRSTAGRFWDVKSYEENRIVLALSDAHMAQGFPGNASIEVTYEVTEEDGLAISYYAIADQKTIFNFTNHAYFNLNGQASGDILDCTLEVKASHYTPVQSERAIPTGEIAPVDGTPFDFREAKTIGRDIHMEDAQLAYGNGYDHNFALDRTGDGPETVAKACGPKTGIQMEVITDCIAMQLYTANGIGGQKGKGGVTYPNHGAMCLETQFFPNAINEANFVSPLMEAGKPYVSKTVYRFGIV